MLGPRIATQTALAVSVSSHRAMQPREAATKVMQRAAHRLSVPRHVFDMLDKHAAVHVHPELPDIAVPIHLRCNAIPACKRDVKSYQPDCITEHYLCRATGVHVALHVLTEPQ